MLSRSKRTPTWQELDSLFAQARQGHEESKERVFSFLRSKILALAKYRVAEAAEDAVQETLIIVHSRFSEFETLEILQAFTHQVLRNKIGNIYQARARKKPVGLEEADLRYDIREEMEASELDRIVFQCIDRLGENNPACREILSYLYHGLDTDEICARLGINKSRLKVRTFRCRMALRDLLLREYQIEL